MAEKTAQLIVKELGFTSIAILSPGYGLNKLKTDFFIEECQQLGIDPVAIEWYMDTPLDLSRQLVSIRQKAWELIPQENNQSDIPLGFNHKTRLEMQNGINQVPSQLLPQQVKYLEQMQQREVLDSQVSPSMNIK